jgi:hypothetical protein
VYRTDGPSVSVPAQRSEQPVQYRLHPCADKTYNQSLVVSTALSDGNTHYTPSATKTVPNCWAAKATVGGVLLMQMARSAWLLVAKLRRAWLSGVEETVLESDGGRGWVSEEQNPDGN